jgi:hypothetical protein
MRRAGEKASWLLRENFSAFLVLGLGSNKEKRQVMFISIARLIIHSTGVKLSERVVLGC